MQLHPRRLIEVDLPIREISAHARREKSIRHGHISTLHIWWARRPLAACRAVLCAALWPDPADEHCPQSFREAVANTLAQFAEQVRTDKTLASLVATHWSRWVRTNATSLRADHPANWADMRYALLDFIADFANWDASTVPAFLETARTLTQAAHESLGGTPGTRPLVADPFAGGGAIPLEALRVGADAFASDLNPVAVLLNKVVLEYIPRYGQQLADEVRKWGQWIKEQAEAELAAFYPSAHLPPEAYTPQPDPVRKIAGVDWTLNAVHRETPIAYIWARTVTCEGPNCGAEVPLMRSLWLAKKTGRSVALHMRPDPDTRKIYFDLIEKTNGKWVNRTHPQSEIKNPQFDGPVRRGSATCPVCGYTTPVERVRVQLRARRGGAHDARLVAVVTTMEAERTAPKRETEIFAESGRFYRLPTETDLEAVRRAAEELERRKAAHVGALSLIPDEVLDIRGIRHTWGMIYGLDTWGELFSPRQALTLSTFVRLVIESANQIDPIISGAVQSCLALNIDKVADLSNSLCRWEPIAQCPRQLFARQAIPIIWDFAEGIPIGDSSGSFNVIIGRFVDVLNQIGTSWNIGQTANFSAAEYPLPTDSVNAYITDPPYYDSVPYAHLSDFFYVWLRRALIDIHPDLFRGAGVPKDQEIVVDRPHELSNSNHDISFYERELTKAFGEGRRVLIPNGIGTIVFASKTTASWEAILQAVVDAGWTVTGSWPIDTEMATRVAAQGQARLASSIHLVCRPRESVDGELTTTTGDWREVLRELPGRIHAWLPRLAHEGIVGADAIFACLGPALEIFSRYSRVEKASGEVVHLRDYLEHVWAAVAQEALATILNGGDASGFEADARLTVIWFWVLKTEADQERNGNSTESGEEESQDEIEEESSSSSKTKVSGYTMEYDAARKLAQGLGADLQQMSLPGGIVTIKGNIAALNKVASREQTLLGKQLFLFVGDEPDDLPKSYRTSRDPTAILHAVERRQPELLSEKPEIKSNPDQPFLPAFAPEKDTRSMVERLKEGGETLLDRLHQAMLLFGHGQTALLGHFLNETGMGKNPYFWRLAQALSALYPSASDEKRWVDGVLGRKKGLGF